MKIGIAGLMSLDLLDFKFSFSDREIQTGYSFPLISLIINALLEKGHSVVAYTCSWKITEPMVYESEKLTICIAPRFRKAGWRLFNKEKECLTQLMQKYPADIINAQWTYEFAQAALDSGQPTIITIRDHASTILKYELNLYTLSRWWMNYQVVQKGKYFIANSHYLYQLLNKKKQTQTRIISNFFKKGLEQEYDLYQSKENYIISIANLSPKRKNLINGIRAFAKLRQKYPNLNYYLVGKGTDEGDWLYNLAHKEGILNGLVFMGQKNFSEVISLIKSAKILLHTSLEETFGNVVLEGMILGTPVVGGSQSGNIPYLLDKGNAGLLCNMKSPNEIAETIVKLLDNENHYNEIRQYAHNFALQNFFQDKIIDDLLKYYVDVLSKN